MRQADLAVVGGGASGLAAAFCAAKAAQSSKKSIVVLEKNARVGKKLLVTGNGRCNITNRNAGDLSHFHGDEKARDILNRFPPERVLEAFQNMGLLCRELDGGRMYPYSLQASSVLNTLRRGLDSCGVESVCDFPVQSVQKKKDGFVLSSEKEKLLAKTVILAAGGAACPKSGSDGDGFALAKSLGHTVRPVFPSLVLVKTDPARVRPLKGVRCPCRAAFSVGGKQVRAATGEVQFADGALSGICIFELSRCVGEWKNLQNAEISLDLFPDYSKDALRRLFFTALNGTGPISAYELLEGFLPKAVAIELSKFVLGSASHLLRGRSEKDLEQLAAAAKDFRFPVRGTFSWDRAQVTAGGVPLSELKDRLESKKCPGLYLCGELLDVDGDCGGFNLHWAWASGVTAGEAAADAFTERK